MVDVGQLLAFEFLQADGLSPLRTLASAVDAAVEAPGLPLVFFALVLRVHLPAIRVGGRWAGAGRTTGSIRSQ